MKNIKELPVSEYQKRFFLEWAIDPESTKYNISYVYKIIEMKARLCLQRHLFFFD